MKPHITAFTVIVAALAGLMTMASCQKETPKTAETFDMNVTGIMAEYEAESKAELVNSVRASWKGGEKVYVYDGEKCLGALTTTLEGDNDRWAYLSGKDLLTPKAGTTALTLVYSPSLTAAPAIEGGKVSIDLSQQDGTKSTFVIYATLEAKPSYTNEVATFSFATSVLRVNCTGLKESEAITKAEMSNLNTTCVLEMSGTGAPTVTSADKGTITRTGIGSANTQGEAVFQVAFPYEPAAEGKRVLKITQGTDAYADETFTTAQLKVAVANNTICQLEECLTVTFNANGHGTAPEDITGIIAGSTITAPTVPTADGFEFKGWYREAACTNAWNFATDKVTANTTLYAKWIENENKGEINTDVEYVEINGLKWAKQNLAISICGKMKWKGNNSKAVKVPGTDEDVVIGDYFQWAAYSGYCGNEADSDKGLLVYTSFSNTHFVGGYSDAFWFKPAKQKNDYYCFMQYACCNGADACAPYFDAYPAYTYTKYMSSSDILEASDDVANIILGGTWRMPTPADFEALKAATYWTWDFNDEGVYVFPPDSQHKAGTDGQFLNGLEKSDALLFFPAAGQGYQDELRSGFCSYWTSRTSGNINALSASMGGSWGNLNITAQDRSDGMSIRPVSD